MNTLKVSNLVFERRMAIATRHADDIAATIPGEGAWLDFKSVVVMNAEFADRLIQRILDRKVVSARRRVFIGFKNVSQNVYRDLARGITHVRVTNRLSNLAFLEVSGEDDTYLPIGDLQATIKRAFDLVWASGTLTAAKYREIAGNKSGIATYSTYMKDAYDLCLLDRHGDRANGFIYTLPPL